MRRFSKTATRRILGCIQLLAIAWLLVLTATPTEAGRGSARGRGHRSMSAGSRTRVRPVGATRSHRTRATRVSRSTRHSRGRPTGRSRRTWSHHQPRHHDSYWHPARYYYYRPYPLWYPRPTVRYVRVYGEESHVAPSGMVETDIRPRSAQVLVGDTAVGFVREFDGPAGLLFLAPGIHSLGFAAPGYMTLRRTVRVEAGGSYRIQDRLQEGSGLDPRSDPPIDSPYEIERDPGPSRDGPEEPAAPGRLAIRASPQDAAVYLDGGFLGRADELSRLHGDLAIGLGEHLLEIVRPGFLPETRRFTLENEEPLTIALDLQPTD